MGDTPDLQSLAVNRGDMMVQFGPEPSSCIEAPWRASEISKMAAPVWAI
ncbi:hypothetical protein [Phenylobacterium sp. J367]|nr:hypothetical protein [Phenylobacterium sp. J367]MCR5877916.1 hypothetical protein [Phenylobacterium sp. J367]